MSNVTPIRPLAEQRHALAVVAATHTATWAGELVAAVQEGRTGEVAALVRAVTESAGLVGRLLPPE